ncbi:DUF2130 domain-containing protein [Streptococcus agalactiae]|nr:hypothetical protein V193_04640 [Streptococcus agalactiae 138P]AHX74989.1 hypothetical protein DN94_04640 [Streptococcus agalactiae]AKU01752.1 hypothetical protein GX026_04670 [Streptococcus agalactiae]AWQ29328.1 DUF2130 domain-containing protein [Streptococcus agalactiae]OVF13005.1 hypothetical protein B7O92_06375 [Streptococcus agalactiae]
MNEIKCPHCGTAFAINESEYHQLLEQIRGDAFDKEVSERLEKERLILGEQAKNQLQEVVVEKDKEIAKLQYKVKQFLIEKDNLLKDNEYQLAEQLNQKDMMLRDLENQIDRLRLEHENSLQEALTKVERERDAIQNQLLIQEKEKDLASVKSDYEVQLKAANEQVEFYKNFKAQQSTKAVGESLEHYAETEFNKVRHLAFPNAYFEKDNTLSSRGSKGDFVYREKDKNDLEFLSIMFEMKNESDDTIKKHKNEDFFKELDKDRREKSCEYAVLVTMLEADNDYYNTGIVDVSHKYPNAFAKNYNSASKNFQKAIDEIDKSIKRMEAVKAALTTSENQLRLANNKLDDVSVKKLTRKNPTMKAKFDALKD